MPRPHTENPYQLLEEARKGWDYFISDETVYEGKLVNREWGEVVSWVDNYRVGDIWLEACATINDSVGIALLIEDCDSLCVVASQPYGRVDKAWRDNTVFVRIRQESQVSEQLEFRPIPSIVWLKTLDFAMRFRQDKFEGMPTTFAVPKIGRSIIQRELNSALLAKAKLLLCPSDMQHGKIPSNVIQGVPQIGGNITDDKPPTLGPEGRLYIHVNQLRSALHYGLFPNGVLWVEQAPDTPFEGVDVYIRPLDLEPGAIKWLHTLYKLA